ncbi:hypothetical protein KUCAC02_027840 [Chaenocephalus aceratus]|nr:hypothetical protein KUCAC02_027840 [Chaenocephalus aceratus]
MQMAGASDPLEDMLFSEVDEKAVSDLVGSLESQLSGQSNPGGKAEENGGSVAPANHHLGKTLPAQAQQQQGRRMHGFLHRSYRHFCSLWRLAVTRSIHHNTDRFWCVNFGIDAGQHQHRLQDQEEQQHGENLSPPVDATTPNSAPLAVTSSINASTFTLSHANIPAGQSAIALDRGTPTIALQRLPSHIVASIAQNGTSVSALVQQGAPVGSTEAAEAAPQGNHSKTLTDTSKADDCQSKIVMSAGSPCVSAQTPPVTSTVSMIRPTMPSPTQSPPPRPGLAAPQRIVAPQLIVRPPQQQTTIQLPPGFSIPQGMVLVRTELAGAPTFRVATPQEMQENVKKCKNFLATLIKLASHNSPSPETSKNVKSLVQDLLDAKIEPEEFTSRLQTELKSSPQPYLVPFLKKSLPALRLSLLSSQHTVTHPPHQGLKPAPGGPPPAIAAGPAVRIRPPHSVSVTAGAGMGHAAGMGMRAGAMSGQVRMPTGITHPVRAQGTMCKAGFIQGRSPMAAQMCGNQKNKLNDPGGGSFRYDESISQSL